MGAEGVTVMTSARAMEATESKTTPRADVPDMNEDELMNVLSRRRTSIPPSFTYGSDETESSKAEERRWRSFDCAGASTGALAASLDALSLRIEAEQSRVEKQTAKLRPRKRTALLRTVSGVFASRKSKEQVELRQMQMVAQVAKANRSLVILNDMRTLVLTMDDEDASALETPRSTSSVLSVDNGIQRMLDGIADADQVLPEDSLHHILELQTQFLQKTIEMHADKKVAVSRTHGLSASLALQQFLGEFIRSDGIQRVPCSLDVPTAALVKFEMLLNRYKMLKPQVKRSFDQLCRDTMSSFTRPSATGHARVWEERAPRDVMQSLLRELEDAVLETAWVSEKYRSILRVFLEQLVFSRLSGACYRNTSVELDEQNAAWRQQIIKARELSIDEVGLPVEVPENIPTDEPLFAKSIDAFNRLPHLVPSSVMAAFLNAVRVLYSEANELLGLTCRCISADVLLPLLVFVLSRTDLPHLHSQVYLMEEFAIDASQEGSEAAYYLACLQAAMGYIMTEIGKQ